VCVLSFGGESRMSAEVVEGSNNDGDGAGKFFSHDTISVF